MAFAEFSFPCSLIIPKIPLKFSLIGTDITILITISSTFEIGLFFKFDSWIPNINTSIEDGFKLSIFLIADSAIFKCSSVGLSITERTNKEHMDSLMVLDSLVSTEEISNRLDKKYITSSW
ncbi:hypothetical protein WICMUC_003526 [Wickerhamomyces mucosus]|uniref:Uncharacterized protein n=1 Tax=Wickerhamomyces mucosus TaxID=1378264 RepID=A0A9P8TBQ4_9ASCO|nr:hypothetical protein WICMUC_003526 [Wickerhamomyces mucosus]